MYVSQTIMSYSLNLYSTVCQLYLSETARKNPLENVIFLADNQPGLF